jgi:glycosyltransferase involved in cell wall biosynthesis
MRVSLVTETYFPQVNGVSRTLGELVRHLGERGDQVQLIHPDYGESALNEHTHLVRSIRMPFYKELYLPLPPFGAVRRAIDAFRPELVHIATEATLGLAVLRHVLFRKIATVSSFHTNFDQYSRHYRIGWARGTIWRYLRWFHNRTRETYVPSLTTIRGLENLGFDRLVLWPRGVDSTLFRPDRPGRQEVRRAMGWSQDDLVISYVSRIAPEKNVADLADALEIVAARRPDVRILFVGDGPSRKDLEQRLGTIARFAGYRTGEDLADHYSAGDLFVFSSLTETFGNVVLEAMASGMPVIAVRAGGVGDTVQSGITGLLVEPGDPAVQLAEAVLTLVDQAEVRIRMSRAARAYAQSQSWDCIMGELRQRYQLAIDKHAGAAAEPVVVS